MERNIKAVRELEAKMSGLNYICPKCSSAQYEVGEIRAAGGFWSKIFDVQGQRFTTVTCKRCKYSELFKAHSSKLGNNLTSSQINLKDLNCAVGMAKIYLEISR